MVHARKAWLNGVSPKENRTLPPLRYERVARLKEAFPTLEIVVNGGITSAEQVRAQLACVDGVMIGREAYRHPFLMLDLDRMVFGECGPRRSRADVVRAYLPYLARELVRGTPAHHVTRHLVGLYQGEPGAARWRRALGARPGPDALANALAAIESTQGAGFSGGGSRPKSDSATAAM
jgi:tRNA-dihydrouridine synthase A